LPNNFCDFVSFEIYLPKDTTLWPHMNCVVHDSILKGLVQPVLGSFSINLAELALKTQMKLDKKLKKIAEAFMKSIFQKVNKMSFFLFLAQAVGPAFTSLFQTPMRPENKGLPAPKESKGGFFDLEIGKSAGVNYYFIDKIEIYK